MYRFINKRRNIIWNWFCPDKLGTAFLKVVEVVQKTKFAKGIVRLKKSTNMRAGIKKLHPFISVEMIGTSSCSLF